MIISKKKKDKVSKKKASEPKPTQGVNIVQELQQELDDLMQQIKEVAPSPCPTPVQENQMVCPIHLDTPLKRFKAKTNGKVYYRCSSSECSVFCAMEDLLFYCSGVNGKLHDSYRAKPCPNIVPICACGYKVSLRVSKREGGNHQRPFFTCGQKESCNFFQWADQPLREDNHHLYQNYTIYKQSQAAQQKQLLEKFMEHQRYYFNKEMGAPTTTVIQEGSSNQM